MTMLESTISMIKVMPEADLAEIQDFARKLLQKRNADCPFALKSEEDIYRDLAVSHQQIAEGRCKEMGQAIGGIREKYGL